MVLPFMPPESFVSGGIFLIVFGALVAYFRRLPTQIWGFMERHLFVSLHVFDNDESFHWIRVWLGEKLKDTKSKSIFTRRVDRNNDGPSIADGDNSEETYRKINDFNGKDRRPQASFVPAPNVYFFWFNKKLCWVNYERKESEGQIGLQKPRESFTIRCLSRNNKILEDMIREARDAAIPIDNRLEIRVGTTYCWELFGRVDSRSIESVILPDKIPQMIVADIKKFQESKEWYSKLGIPYRRGILLYGPPGNGKSSLVLAVASELGMNVSVLFLSDPNMTDGRLQELMNKTDNNTVVLIEDIDSAFQKRKKSNAGPKNHPLTFSGLLNSIDGLAAQGGRILFMTTNKIDKLDPALIRPGRADIRVLIPNARKQEAKILFERFYPNIPEEIANQFISSIPEDQISMASIQGHLLKHRDNPFDAVEKISSMIEEENQIKAARNKKNEEE